MKFEHAVVVLELKQKAFAISRTDLLLGLESESASLLSDLGRDGWEMVSSMPFSSGSVGMFSNAAPKTDSALAFFKREVA